jgi:hypothetical protein
MHNIRYLTYKEDISRVLVMADVCEIAKRDGDGYDSNITWHNVSPLESYEEAEKFIKEKDTGWYSDHAVRYKDYSSAKKTTKITEYEAKVLELKKAKNKYKKAHSVHSFQAKHIGCPKCGSKLNKKYFIGEHCPLCRADLRAKTTIEKIEWYDAKIKDYESRIDKEKQKQKKYCKIMWLVKIEYHS